MNAISFSMLNKLKMVDFFFHKFVFLTFIGDCSLFTIFSEVRELLALSDKFSPLGSTSRKKEKSKDSGNLEMDSESAGKGKPSGRPGVWAGF